MYNNIVEISSVPKNYSFGDTDHGIMVALEHSTTRLGRGGEYYLVYTTYYILYNIKYIIYYTNFFPL